MLQYISRKSGTWVQADYFFLAPGEGIYRVSNACANTQPIRIRQSRRFGALLITSAGNKRKGEIQSSLEKAMSGHQTSLVAWCCPVQVKVHTISPDAARTNTELPQRPAAASSPQAQAFPNCVLLARSANSSSRCSAISFLYLQVLAYPN